MCDYFAALSLLDRVLALHACCPEPPAPSDTPPLAFSSSAASFSAASTTSSSPLSSATTPLLSRHSPIFQPLQSQQYRGHNNADPLLFSHSSSSSSLSAQPPCGSAVRCHTPLTMLSSEFSLIMGECPLFSANARRCYCFKHKNLRHLLKIPKQHNVHLIFSSSQCSPVPSTCCLIAFPPLFSCEP
jgi:hypothetical protein